MKAAMIRNGVYNCSDVKFKVVAVEFDVKKLEWHNVLLESTNYKHTFYS